MLYLYAIIDPAGALPSLPPALEDTAPEVMPFDGFRVVAGLLRDIPERDETAVRRHMAVLTALMPHTTVLPAQFGTVFPSRDAFEQALAGMTSAISADLRRFAGQIELGLCVRNRTDATTAEEAEPHDEEAIGQGPGARYIAGKRTAIRRQLLLEQANEALAAKVCATPGVLTALATNYFWRSLPSTSGLGVSVAFLLPSVDLDAFYVALAALRLAERDLDIFCLGPWPPFSFVGHGGRNFSDRKAYAESDICGFS